MRSKSTLNMLQVLLAMLVVSTVTVIFLLRGAAAMPALTDSSTAGQTDQHLPVIIKALPTATPDPTPQPGPVIVNGGFEAGHVGWDEFSAHGYYIILPEGNLPIAPHNGSWATWFGGEYDEVSIIEQVITIPNDRYILNYWLWIASADICNVEYDIAGVLVADEAVDAFLLCEENNTNGWIPRSVNLSDYAGQRVTLTFAAFTDSVLNSNLFIDDVSMNLQPQAGAEGAGWGEAQENGSKQTYVTPDAPVQRQPASLSHRERLVEFLWAE